MCPKARETKAKLNYCYYTKIKFSKRNEPLTKEKDNLLNGRRYLQVIYPIKD